MRGQKGSGHQFSREIGAFQIVGGFADIVAGWVFCKLPTIWERSELQVLWLGCAVSKLLSG